MRQGGKSDWRSPKSQNPNNPTSRKLKLTKWCVFFFFWLLTLIFMSLEKCSKTVKYHSNNQINFILLKNKLFISRFFENQQSLPVHITPLPTHLRLHLSALQILPMHQSSSLLRLQSTVGQIISLNKFRKHTIHQLLGVRKNVSSSVNRKDKIKVTCEFKERTLTP